MPRHYDDDYGTARRGISGATRVEYEYGDGSSETHSMSRKPPASPSRYITKTQDGEVPEGVTVTSKPRASGALRRKFIEHLGTAFADEYITKEEFDARHAEADKAETDAELRVLISDLPSLPAPKVEEKPLTWKKFKKDFWGSVTAVWNSGTGTATKYALFVLTFSGGIALAIVPAFVLLAPRHPLPLAMGLGIFTIVAGVFWTIANITALVNYVDNL
jgi:hypothetical protein